MTISFGRHLASSAAIASQPEWLITNGIGGYGCGTVAGVLTRHYHGLLVAALEPPLARTLLVTKVNEAATYLGQVYDLGCDRWADGALHPQGYLHLESFRLEGTIPIWVYAIADARLEKRVWMEPGANTTYLRYTVSRASAPMALTLKVLVNHRNHHHSTQGNDWQMAITDYPQGLQIQAQETVGPFYLLSETVLPQPAHTWYTGYALALESDRGIHPYDDHLHAATFGPTLAQGQSFTLVATTDAAADCSGQSALLRRLAYEQHLIAQGKRAQPDDAPPAWVSQLVLAADQFIVNRPLVKPQAQLEATTLASPPHPDASPSASSPVAGTGDEGHHDQPPLAIGKSIIAGYPWFGDWGRDTMIALPGLTLATGRPTLARIILQTFAPYLSQGMLPNAFPEGGEAPHYNTVDATLWYFEALRAYHQATGDTDLIADLFPQLDQVITWHCKGTRHSIQVDATDGLLYAGEPGVQLTWMDAKVDDWVVTPRVGKPIEVNALWYNALLVMTEFAGILGQPVGLFQELAAQTRQGFQRFWSDELGHCYDLLDGPAGNDSTLRPNQILAVALPDRALGEPCLRLEQQRAVVDIVAQRLLTSHGLRSLDPAHPSYQGHYGGDPVQRDGAYHQGTVWSWLMGPFVQAHWRVYQDADLAHSFLDPLIHHLHSGCLGTISEIFDGHAPMAPRGAFAQAWSVAEVLRVSALLRPFLIDQ
ncbi:glycogen debranching enzyme family protein [Nodosilinea sp. LEGE 07088]|uniref:amylo-alpha-1,6-glucosidase n=1 Tax=Nodosilinea sp. LEGE 07088 TaxID=2777968 RepID=UPI0018806380|nr:amylo-alpha-1,6-glucosidase [Nodosilinea sp. LEGE 07088]MBE9139044.1 glycogen debranching enzyme family protein [Nodosilinea sp. LEGE 07088]